MRQRAALLYACLTCLTACARTAGSRAEAELEPISDGSLTGRVQLEKGSAETAIKLDVQGPVPELVTVALLRDSCGDLRQRIAGRRTSGDAREAISALPHQHLGTLNFQDDRRQAKLTVPDDTLIQRASVIEQTLVFYRGTPGANDQPKPLLACADLR